MGTPVAIEPVRLRMRGLERLPDGATHPEADCGGYAALRLADRSVTVGLCGGGIHIDLDGDGFIGADERTTLPGVLKSAVEGHRLSLSLSRDRDRIAVGVDAMRAGTLPDGVRFGIYSEGGSYKRPRLVIDANADGSLDLENRWAVFRDVVVSGGRAWRFEVPADGAVVTFEALDKPGGSYVGAPAPDFDLPGSDGRRHSLRRYRGKSVLLDFWATWCTNCRALQPELEALAACNDVEILGISADTDLVAVRRWSKKNKKRWPSAAVGPEGAVNRAYGVASWPMHALIDEEGRMVAMGNLDAVRDALPCRGTPVD